MGKSFKGRAILPGQIEGQALVTHAGFNTYASFYTSMHTQAPVAQCSDSGNPDLYQKNMSGKILCLPKTIGSTSGGAVWQRPTGRRVFRERHGRGSDQNRGGRPSDHPYQ